jgi:hypothetical protein
MIDSFVSYGSSTASPARVLHINALAIWHADAQ